MSHAPMVSQRPRPPPRARAFRSAPTVILDATIVASSFLGARSSVAEQSAHNRSVAGSIPAGPMSCSAPEYLVAGTAFCRCLLRCLAFLFV